jgi:acyl-CoA synthetase (AMP-forming)/AMP-acid ligase II
MRCLSTDEFTALALDGDAPPDSFPWSDETDFLITLSSGSTGVPKPIVLSQAVKAARARQTWELYGLNDAEVVLCASPYFHSLGQRLVFVALLRGATLVHLAQFTPKQWLGLVATHKVSFVIAVSSHLYALKRHLLENVEQIRSLRTIVTSSAPIDASFKEQLFREVGCDFHEIYGATEVAIASNLAPAHARRKFATVGLPCDGVEIRILDDAGRESPCNAIGEIAVSSPLAFAGYYRQPALTAASLRDGFFLTGDLGTIDEEGFLSYVSRKKDVIISGGINIYPGDIEKVLSQLPAVREAAVIGVEDELLGEVLVAVCAGEGEADMEVALRGLANRHLAPFQRPLKYFFVEALPLTASGKIAKQVLRERYGALNDGWTLALRMMLYGE